MSTLPKRQGCVQAGLKEKFFIKIKAVKFRKDGFYSQALAFGGEEGPEKFEAKLRYRGSLQNYLIDTGDEVILVDTGYPESVPVELPDENSMAFTGKLRSLPTGHITTSRKARRSGMESTLSRQRVIPTATAS